MNLIFRVVNKRFFIFRWLAIGMFLIWLVGFSRAESSAEFRRTLAVTNAEPVKLTVAIGKGDVDIVYSHDGEVLVSALAQPANESSVDENYFRIVLEVEQVGNNVSIRQTANPAYPEENLKLRYRIEVPNRTEVRSSVKSGRLNIRGVTGPVDVKVGTGDVSVSYVSRAVHVEAERGSLDFQLIGERVDASTASGNISGERLGNGIRAETGDGDIKLMVVGPSEAMVKNGAGRVEIGGARDALAASTQSGDVRVQAIPHHDWKLSSISGNIRLELPPRANFELDASSESGKLQFDRDDLPKLTSEVHQIVQKVNIGGSRIEAHSGSGAVVIR